MCESTQSDDAPGALRRGAGIVLYRRVGADIEFVLVKSAHQHDWGFPKGHVEPGESLADAARREVTEETGLTPTDYRLDPNFERVLRYTVTTRSGRTAPKEVTAYLAEVVPDATVVRSDEHEATRWASPADVAARVVHDDLRAVFVDAAAHVVAAASGARP